ncbi:uncharacterized protein LOC106656896 isoform X1 [Trichogramma pretiosum]|uniref:uncharacterized protein LOC106656896 isoform X1 n=1 Tax=Trichogramma pretiosum TaxID=7493 RepID=UPI0006C9AC79|nr:uncharacterized protein LOC106656896 isoform X1 [Trichogramma pretiosum]XP_023318702.1 uncharacterized protein LOC106656896 isoform X1 [Trichogramma pretiosum]XP_023318703.1 uncharacterized protein LOC106656896 isoform X1 [Trichogramma pretiosum]
MRYSESFVIIVGALCQQCKQTGKLFSSFNFVKCIFIVTGTEVPMKHISTRIAFFHIMIFSYLFYNYYSASIVSARLNEPVFKINDSLNEMSKLNMKLASEWMVYFELFIKKVDWDIQTFYNKTWSAIPEAEQFMLPEKAMHFVQRGGFAYHAHPDVSYPFINRFFSNKQICELKEVHLAQPTSSTFAVSRNSTLTEILKIGFFRLSEVGLRKRQLLRWTSVRPRCQKSILNASSIDIYEFAPHLLILLLGMAFAFGILIFEIVLYDFKIGR